MNHLGEKRGLFINQKFISASFGACRTGLFSNARRPCAQNQGEIVMAFKKFLVVSTVAALTLGAQAAQAQNCMEVLARTPEASSFVSALVRTGQTTLLRGAGPFTIL